MGVPAKLVRVAGVKVDFAAEVDQIHVLDPIQTELKRLCERVEELERKLAGVPDAPQSNYNATGHAGWKKLREKRPTASRKQRPTKQRRKQDEIL